jgi:glycosyltransferase involved in cell wall biosynthesis
VISVVVPCFNAAKYLGAALESVLAQTVAVDEIVVVDDGSTDDSVGVVAAYGDRVRLLVQANQGAAIARNAGVAASRGDLIAFLDADDLWLPQTLSSLSAVLTPAMDAAMGMVEHFISDDLDDADAARRERPPVRVARMTGALLLRRPLFDTVGEFDATLRMGEMMDWFARFDAAGHTIAECHTVVMRRRIHAANTVYQRDRTQASYLAALRQNIARRRTSGPTSA